MTDSRGPVRILIVEDERPLRRIMTRVLAADGYDLLSTDNGLAALVLLERHAATIDLVVTGLAMPLLDGVELYRALRRRGIAVPVLFVSGFAATELTAELRSDPGARFLAKPWTVEDLQRVVSEMLDPDPLGSRPRAGAGR